MHSYLSLLKIQIKRTLRVPMVPIFSIVFPLIIMFSFLNGNTDGLSSSYQKDGIKLVSGLNLVIILVITMANIPASIITAKASNLLKKLKFSEINIPVYLSSVFVANFLFMLLASTITWTIAILHFNLEISTKNIVLYIFPILCVYTFFFFVGVIIANFCSDIEQNQSVIIPVYFLSLLLSGVFIPFSVLPIKIREFLTQYNPVYYFNSLLQINHFTFSNFLHSQFLITLLVLFLLILTLKLKFKYE
ncbi:ABC transporter permease [Priestia aryabhattai]